MRVHHVALWVGDLERMREFYVAMLGGSSGAVYENPRTGFRSCFITFAEGRLELMTRGERRRTGQEGEGLGYAHVALAVGSRAAVDAHVARLRSRGVRVLGEPRTTGDGYYEAVIADPEGNRVEIVA